MVVLFSLCSPCARTGHLNCGYFGRAVASKRCALFGDFANKSETILVKPLPSTFFQFYVRRNDGSFAESRSENQHQ